jgi:hypothetical protein
VSVGFALRATDGFVVVTDGRTSDVGSGRPLTDHAVKVTAAPDDLPFVVVALGRAAVNGVPVNKLVGEILAGVPYETLRATDLKMVTLMVVAGLNGAAKVWPQAGYDADGEELTVGFHILVAGYSLDASPEVGAEVWTATSPSTGMGPEVSVGEVTLCGFGKRGRHAGVRPIRRVQRCDGSRRGRATSDALPASRPVDESGGGARDIGVAGGGGEDPRGVRREAWVAAGHSRASPRPSLRW